MLSSQDSAILNEIRKDLFYSQFDLDKCTDFYNRIIETGEKSPTFTAYQAAAKALMAKYSWNPVTKISSLRDVQNLLKTAIDKEKENLEIRFLRHYIESNIPSYLGFSKNLLEDGLLLKQNIAIVKKLNLDKTIGDYITTYVENINLSKPSKKVKSASLKP